MRIIIINFFFLWRSIVKYVLNLSTDNNCGWMLGMFFHGGNENLFFFLFFVVFLVVVVVVFYWHSRVKRLLLNLSWHLCGYECRVEKIDEQRASQILKQKISFPKWRNSQYTRLTWVNKTKCRRMSTLWCQRSCHNIGGIRMFVELKSSFQRAILCVYHVKIFFFAREKRDQNI